MREKNLQAVSKTENPNPNFLSLMFGKEAEWPLFVAGEKEEGKVDTFEKGLIVQLTPADTVEEAVNKMVKVALAAEFGVSLLKDKGSEAMVRTIARGITGDSTLRKQALLIIDRMLSKKREMSEETPPSKIAAKEKN